MEYKPQKLGILGGGQLGKMLIQEATNLNLQIHILDPDPDCPCKDLSHNYTQGDFRDYEQVLRFGKEVDILTIEIEHVNVDALFELQDLGVKIFPQPDVIKVIQDKGLQKQFFTNNNIPTSNYEIVQSKSDIKFKEPGIVQKLRKGGYDGKGVQILKSSTLKSAFNGPSVIEDLVDIYKEISVIVGRDINGETIVYEPVECQFNEKENLVEFLQMPADLDIPTSTLAKDLAVKVSNDLGIVGILAVEMFISNTGEVLVNELAPRPHNSGHQTIESCYTSQFEQHIRCILNLPLGSSKIIQPSVMVNLLGESGYQGPAKYDGLIDVLGYTGVYVHLYGKKYTKPFRKMGHVTIIGDNINESKSLGRIVLDKLKVVS